ncbi:methylamine utilization protein [Methylobacterium tardum]|uniref:methylamine utilization protein n=1 Tax=Methylobacterium tardum TaxID=374432 RepID=UPI00361E59CE
MAPALGAATVLALAGAAVASLPGAEHIVSQKGKRFGPEAVNLRPGERVTIVNDDSNFVHHAYVEAPDLAYDSGDIEPGGRAVITFPKEGDFFVLCGVHPKMKLAVHVR